jgi:protein-disulfide isomerase
MDKRRIIFWSSFVIALGLIVWGLVAAMNKPLKSSLTLNGGIIAADHERGPKDAPITIIEYSDFQCPACETYYYFVKKLLDESSMTIRFAYRHFPLSQHANAMSAALATEAASVQGKFWEMYDLLFSNHTDWTELANPTDVFVGYAKEIGLNVDEFKKDIASSTLRDDIQADLDGGLKMGIDSTPTFFVNGKAISNPPTYEEFKTIVETAAKGSSN